MSHQINLLVREARPPLLSAGWSLAGLSVLTLLVLGYWAYLWLGIERLNTTVAQNNSIVTTAKSALAVLTQKVTSRPDPAKLTAEIEALKAQASEGQQIISLLQATDKGSEGYAGHLTTLARLSQDDVWLNTVKISNAGRTVSLAGRSLQEESVLRYAHRLNERFATYGVRFTALELTPERPSDNAAKTAMSSIVFKLY